MAQSKKHITPENVTEWLASTGFLFPRNNAELERFEKLFEDEDFGLTGTEIDPDKIIDGSYKQSKIIELQSEVDPKEFNRFKMAARNGKELPDHIKNKILKNQSKPKDDSGQPEDPTK